jgi:replicative DNA helicase
MTKDSLKTEQQFIYLLLNNKNLVGDWLDSLVRKEYFNQDHLIILTAIEECFNKDVILTRKSFLSLVNKISSPQKRLEQEIVFQDCSLAVADKNDFPLLSSSIIENYLKRESIKSIEKYTKDIKKIGVQSSLIELSSSLNDLNEGSGAVKEEIIYDDITSFSESHIKYVDGIRSGEIKEPPRVLCGISEIDETMKVGFKEGHLTLFCADVGGFKSTMMLNIAMNIWQQGHNVLFVPIEMAEDMMYKKAWAREAKVNSENIMDPTKLSDEERGRLVEAQSRWNQYDSKLFMLHMPRETKVSSIKRQIEKYLTIFKPRIVVIDYIDNMDPDTDRKGRYDLEISDMLKKLRKTGQNLGFSVVSGAQLGRDALKRIRAASSSKTEVMINSEDIRGAHSFAMDADTIYAQFINPTQKSLLDLFVIKARYGDRRFPNGKFKATLFVTPEIGLIESEEDFEIAPGENELMNKMFEAEEDGSGEVVFDDDDDDDDNEDW